MRSMLIEDDADAVKRNRDAVAILAISVSAACSSLASRAGPRKPHVPLSACTSRKMVLSISAFLRILLETHELDVELVKVLASLGQEFAQELVHTPPQARQTGPRPKLP